MTRIARRALVRAVVGWLWVAVPLLAVHYWFQWRGGRQRSRKQLATNP